MREVDTDGDGVVTYEEFVPICFDMCVELLKDQLKKATPPIAQRTPSAYLGSTSVAVDQSPSPSSPSTNLRRELIPSGIVGGGGGLGGGGGEGLDTGDGGGGELLGRGCGLGCGLELAASVEDREAESSSTTARRGIFACEEGTTDDGRASL